MSRVNAKGSRHSRHVPHWMKERLYVEQAGRCHWCNRMCVPSDGKVMDNDEQPPDLWTVDHLTPRSKGGSNSWSNLVGACRECNVKKGYATASEYSNGVAKPWTKRLPVQVVEKAVKPSVSGVIRVPVKRFVTRPVPPWGLRVKIRTKTTVWGRFRLLARRVLGRPLPISLFRAIVPPKAKASPYGLYDISSSRPRNIVADLQTERARIAAQ